MARAFTRDELAQYLRLPDGLADRIVGETTRTGLLGCEGTSYYITPAGSRFLQLVRASDRAGLHTMMMRHPAYAALIDLLRSVSHVSMDELEGGQQPVAFPFHRAELHMACSWAEEIGTMIQQNTYTRQYYLVGELHAQFIPVFLKVYHQLEIPVGPAEQGKPVPVHIVREFTCQRLHIAREDFDSSLRDLCEQQPDIFLPSHPAGSCKRSAGWRLCGRRAVNRNFPGYFSGKRSSECIGINGRMYRFILCKDR
jgi:hypothetical protein